MPQVQSDEHKVPWSISLVVLNSVIILLLEPEFIGYLGVTRLDGWWSGKDKAWSRRPGFEFRLHLLIKGMTLGKLLSLSMPQFPHLASWG